MKSVQNAGRKTVLVLPDIRSLHNVGSIFRTADAAGVSRILITGYTPCPTDAFGRARKEIAKTALGAELSIPWEYIKQTKKAISKLKEEGYRIIALEQDKKSKGYRDEGVIRHATSSSVALVLGNEVEGVSRSILKECDDIVEIPMRGKKESLNVSVALGIALFGILDL
jgi:tRNA G18 (ribose-2'-O)-methylase SpoU